MSARVISHIYCSMLVSIATMLLILSAEAADLPGVSFRHNDWEIDCDNTRTCRAAGYQGDDPYELTVSVLLTRLAGPRQPVSGQLMIGAYGDTDFLKALPSVFTLSMKINERSLGSVIVDQKTLVAKLSQRQVSALISAVARRSNVEWTAGDNVWRLSNNGATAVLTKMDEFQGRIGTKRALLRKGSHDEHSVLLPLPAPVVMSALPAKAMPGDNQLMQNDTGTLTDELRATVTKRDCPDLVGEYDASPRQFSAHRLTKTKLLVSTQCWLAAYNSGDGFWVINEKPPHQPVLVTAHGSGYGDGAIFSSQKSRGLGDCWSTEGWTWDGKEFVHTESSSTGMCKLIAPGGAWPLPLIVTDVRHPLN